MVSSRIQTVLIAGAGAVGLPTAETIYKYNPDCVSILAKDDRLKRYTEDGLQLNGQKVNFRLSCGEKADLIIIACKFHHLNRIIGDITPSLGPDTIILSLLNGISSEEIIGAKLGRERLPLAMILGTDAVRTNAPDEGAKVAFSRRGVIHFGGAEGGNNEREERIAEFFTRAGVEFKLESNMRRTLWFKFMINVGINQVTAALRLPYGAISNKGGPREIPEARELAEKAMREVISVANAEGINLNDSDIENWYKTVNGLNPEGFTSMCQDVMAKRKTELEMFSPVIMELGKKHRIPVPINETLFLQLRTIEKMFKNIA